MPTLRAAALLLAYAACDRPSSPAQDAATYALVLANVGRDPDGDLARCATLSDEALAGDCAAVVAVAAAKQGGDAAAWCARVPAGKWRDECSFQTAEQAFARASPDAAVGLCQQAGAYEADCLVHLWRPQLGRLMEGMGPGELAARYEAADQLYQHTARQARDQEILESMFWLSYFGTGLRAGGPVDPSRCATLPEQGARRCEVAVAVLQTEPLERILRARDQLAAFCALSPPRAQDVAGLLGVVPSAALNQALQDQQPMICGQGGTALSGGLRTSPGGAAQPR